VIAYFLGGLGVLLGPFFGIMAVDFFAIRKGRFSLPDLYDPSPRSLYFYRNGSTCWPSPRSSRPRSSRCR
jgi:nucleobase:cation symporter-1, NCS1 family